MMTQEKHPGSEDDLAFNQSLFQTISLGPVESSGCDARIIQFKRYQTETINSLPYQNSLGVIFLMPY